MKSTAKIPTERKSAFKLWLLEQGYQVNIDIDGFRVMMYRKRHKSWTQGYTGVTRTLKEPRGFIRFAGSESEAVHQFNTRDKS